MFSIGYGSIFTLFPFFFSIIFVIVIGGFIFTFVKGIGQWSRNNAQPRLTVWGRVAAKRTKVSHHMGTQTNPGSSFTSYYITFEVESGDRMEFRVNDYDYGMLVEGDTGRLQFQGTRFLGFERDTGQENI